MISNPSSPPLTCLQAMSNGLKQFCNNCFQGKALKACWREFNVCLDKKSVITLNNIDTAPENVVPCLLQNQNKTILILFLIALQFNVQRSYDLRQYHLVSLWFFFLVSRNKRLSSFGICVIDSLVHTNVLFTTRECQRKKKTDISEQGIFDGRGNRPYN